MPMSGRRVLAYLCAGLDAVGGRGDPCRFSLSSSGEDANRRFRAPEPS